MSQDMIAQVRTFAQLGLGELYEALKLRVDVFVVEQRCPYAELDDQDALAWHALQRSESGVLTAYARILPPHEGDIPHIGRVVVRRDFRGQGRADAIMRTCLEFLEDRFGSRSSALAAQAHLEGFYQRFGYARIGGNYLWDGIPHVDMRLSAPK